MIAATRPEKPYPDFPLSAHKNGQWCKIIRGVRHFFGPWDDPDGALQRWNAAKADLLAPPVELTPAEIHQRAAEVRASRERQTHFCRDALVAQEFAASVLGVNTRALTTWSTHFWNPTRGVEWRILLRDALLASEWLSGDGEHLLSFEACCRLLNVDSDLIRAKIARDTNPSALLWLTIIRGLELIHLSDKPLAKEKTQLEVPERAIAEHSRWRIDQRANREVCHA